MAMMFMTTVHCPHCEEGLDFFVTGLCSKLGPPLIACPKCKKKAPTGRAEWADLGSSGRTRYVVSTAVFAAAVGYLGGVGVRGAWHFWQNGPWQEKMTLTGPGFVLGVEIWALAVVLVQLYRVHQSDRRSRREPKSWKDVSFTDRLLSFNMQLRFMVGVWVPTLVGWLAAYFMNRP
jgi:hypothetical protein